MLTLGDKLIIINNKGINAPLRINTLECTGAPTTAVVNAEIIFGGGTAILERGFVYDSSNENPTIANSHVSVDGTTGSYSMTLTGLTSGSTYYVRAYLKNAFGFHYGNTQTVIASRVQVYNKCGQHTYYVPQGATKLAYLVIAGGGGGGMNFGGGGGAGGYRCSMTGETSGGGSAAEEMIIVTGQTSIQLYVGAGGQRATGYISGQLFPSMTGQQGENSYFGDIISIGGGGGGFGGSLSTSGKTGGSGSGGANYTTIGFKDGGAGVTGQGYKGGKATTTLNNTWCMAGGGGAGGAGIDVTNTGLGGSPGGIGLTSSITGVAVGRGGGGASGDGSVVHETLYGGGTFQTPPVPNTGGGAATNISSTYVQDGASGVVIIRAYF